MEGAGKEKPTAASRPTRGHHHLYLVAQVEEDSVGDVFFKLDSGVDDVSDEQVDIEEGEDDRGHAQGEPPLGEEPQGEVLQLTGRRQGASVQDVEAKLRGHGGHFLLCFFTVATQVHLHNTTE